MTRSYQELIPSVERRLSVWVSLTEKGQANDVAAVRPTITISRTYGCEGYPLAQRLEEMFSERTGEVWNIYDKALLERVSRDERLSMALLERLGGRSRERDSIGFLVPGYLSQDEAFRHIPKHILQIAAVGNAIIVGRGAPIITQALSNCFHFRLDASFEFRVASIARRLELPIAKAEALVRENQEIRERFVERNVGASLSDLSYYNAIFNNARQDVSAIARAIMAYVANAWADKTLFEQRRHG